MNSRYGRRGRLSVAISLAVLLCAATAHGQLGSHLGTQISFNRPSTSFYLGGRYTRDTGASSPYSFSPTSSSSLGGPLSASLVPGMDGRVPGGLEGTVSYSSKTNLGTLPPSVRPMSMPSAVPSAQPLGESMGSSLPQTAIPRYVVPQRAPNYRFFEATVTADSLSNLQYQGRISLDRVVPKRGTPSGLPQNRYQGSPAGEGSPGVEPTETAMTEGASAGSTDSPSSGTSVQPDVQAQVVRNLSEIKAAQMSADAAAGLQRAIAAARDANYRGTRDQPGAIALFRRVRLVDDKSSGPVVGLVACYVATGDYHQAASLIGLLARQWPDVLADEDLFDPYGSPELMRTHLMGVQRARGGLEDPELDLLMAFLRWFLESRQTASSEAIRLAGVAGPDSSAAALAVAMRQALTSGR